tara:strand:+ start:106 stop:447 length:342 start_codon:yes stop_codon:yes gene_type:complete
MKKTKINYFLEYLSATFILSYFFIHNINLVLIGITLSLYLININFLNAYIRSIHMTLFIKKPKIESNEINKVSKSNSTNIELKKEDTKLTLVETIEELGYIPSIDKNDQNKAA